nr:MAG TPA: nucleoside triphosphate pyrophosphohydrolase [Caudoviricetes sp.]
MTRDEIVTALRCCAEPGRDCKEDCPMNEISREPCREILAPAAADLIENQQWEIEALKSALHEMATDLVAWGRVDYWLCDDVPTKLHMKHQPKNDGNYENEPCVECVKEYYLQKANNNPSVTFGATSPYTGEARAVEDASPYAATAEAPDGDEICRAALDTFGEAVQITMVFEEMAELQDVLCKFLRGRVEDDTRTHIAEEIADVEIMLQQMVMLFDCAGQVEGFRWYKLERLAGRIEEKKNGKENT